MIPTGPFGQLEDAGDRFVIDNRDPIILALLVKALVEEARVELAGADGVTRSELVPEEMTVTCHGEFSLFRRRIRTINKSFSRQPQAAEAGVKLSATPLMQ